MKIDLLLFDGIDIALEAMRLSYNSVSKGKKEDIKLLRKLIVSGDSHAKVMRMVWAWLKITAPRYWWQEFDTYKIGTTAMSQSTVHTLLKKELTKNDFENPDKIQDEMLNHINNLIQKQNLYEVKQILPESFLQTRIVNINYQALRHIYFDRKNHLLPEWKYFNAFISLVLPYNDLIVCEGGVL